MSHLSIPDRVLATTHGVLGNWRGGQSLQNLVLDPELRGIQGHILFTLFRRLASIDWIISRMCQRGNPAAKVRDVFRITLTQILYMDGIEPATVTDTAVRFTKKKLGKRQSGFVNAVLRNVIRQGPDHLLATVQKEAPQNVRLELSPALYEQWRRRMNDAELESIAALLSAQAPVTVRRRAANAPLAEADIPSCLTPLPAPDWCPEAQLWTCRNTDEFFTSEAFAAQEFYVQDPSTLLAPNILGPKAGERIADLCAAPGGKALLISELAGGKSDIVAADRSPERIRRLQENIQRCPDIHAVVGDVSAPFLRRDAFDAILLDVPCSNTGVIRRRPDVRWRFSRQHLNELVELQAQILHCAAPLLRAGGRLVYSTCSIEPEENQEQVAAFCKAHEDFGLIQDRCLKPSEYHDGAYAALLQKKR